MSGECEGCGDHCTECHCNTPDQPNCALCYENKIKMNGNHFLPIYEIGRALWLCDDHMKEGIDRIRQANQD